MLDYNTCAALKDAGYPQTGTLRRRDDWPAEIIPGVNGGSDEGLACPNSDELMAAIQARWPMADSYTLCGLSFVSPTTPNADGKYPLQTQWSASWWIQDVAHHNGRGNSPAAALCALYIALAEGGRE